MTFCLTEKLLNSQGLVLLSCCNLVIPIQNSVLLPSNKIELASRDKIELACRDGFLRYWNDSDSVLHLQLCRNVLLFSISQTFFNVETCISQKILTKIVTGLRIIWKGQNLYVLCSSKVYVVLAQVFSQGT